MTNQRYGAALGFAFVAAWIAFGFGDAILCLVGAAVFAAAAAYWRGELNLADLQDRIGEAATPRRGADNERPASRRVQ
ncbi:MAG TPA: hypothetical protein VFW09_05240 [Solirubrobacteraceae bacterium]|nr:hypothetical protein [Solirubrobacteraceae bacterium]